MPRASGAGELHVGITSWNSGLFLPLCLDALRATDAGSGAAVTVFDNRSTDGSAAIARSRGAAVIVGSASQPDALNLLLARSRAPVTLLMHADVILLAREWFELCRRRLEEPGVALVSPEDVGCGPYSRPFGAGKPESSFLLFDTRKARRARTIFWRRRRLVPVFSRKLDLYGEHVTHNLPARLAAAGYRWHPMDVHLSDLLEAPRYRPAFRPRVWSDELGLLRYGLGNFYSLDGVITHYHNWMDRAIREVAPDAADEHRCGFPLAFIKAYSEAFVRDYAAGALVVPRAAPRTREPKAL